MRRAELATAARADNPPFRGLYAYESGSGDLVQLRVYDASTLERSRVLAETAAEHWGVHPLEAWDRLERVIDELEVPVVVLGRLITGGDVLTIERVRKLHRGLFPR